MLKIFASVMTAWFLVAYPAAGQQVMDGSEKNIPDSLWLDAKAAVAETLIDPYAAQFDRLTVAKSAETIVCGRFNAKNKVGGFVGFRPFLYDGSTKELSINKTNECGKEVIDQDQQARIMAECEDNTNRLNRWTAGDRNGVNVPALVSKGEWCRDWMLKVIASQLEGLGDLK